MEDFNLKWDTPYHEAFFKTSHNSYEKSIKKQLNFGLRGLEYDIYSDKLYENGDFEVYHLKSSYDTALNIDGNPSDLFFSNWLKVINDWSNEQKGDHAPITLFIELKDNLIDLENKPDEDYGIKKLNEIILKSFSSDKLYTYKNFTRNDSKWPILKDLKGRVIIVLTSYWNGHWVSSEGGFESRLKYLKNSLEGKEDICFVSWIDDDRGDEVQFMKENTNFWKCSIEYSTKFSKENQISQRLTRVDYDKIINGNHVKTYYKKNFKAGYRCNFPSTDSWDMKQYDECFPWCF
ncbi:MAG: Ca2+-dependent phosphoinositide-specific phospholipase C [Candidatus Hermodarchaeota archaeon]